MSVLIKGMKMPKDCTECRFAVDGWCYAYGRPNIEALANYERTNFCPLVPVPKHGRLIDADVALRSEQPSNCSDELWAETTLARCINNAPTIIEAEGEE